MASTTSGQCICEFPRQSSGAELVGTIRRVFKHEYLETHSGSTYRRQHVCGSNSIDWTQVTTEVVRPMTPPPDKCLWVIRRVRNARALTGVSLPPSTMILTAQWAESGKSMVTLTLECTMRTVRTVSLAPGFKCFSQPRLLTMSLFAATCRSIGRPKLTRSRTPSSLQSPLKVHLAGMMTIATA